MNTLVVSSSLDADSRSEELARRCAEHLSKYSKARFITLKDYQLGGRDLHFPDKSDAYRKLHALVLESDGLVLCSPVYNWSCCSELKRFIEIVGTTPPDGTLRGAFFDKVVSFVNAAGIPHSYTAFTSLANALMIDFKCVVSPYNLYVTNRDWDTGELSETATKRMRKSMDVFLELVSLLHARTYRSNWEL